MASRRGEQFVCLLRPYPTLTGTVLYILRVENPCVATAFVHFTCFILLHLYQPTMKGTDQEMAEGHGGQTQSIGVLFAGRYPFSLVFFFPSPELLRAAKSG